MKWELCEEAATFHTTTIDSDGTSLSQAFCEHHGRQFAAQAGFHFRSSEESLSRVVASTRRLADYLRANRRMPTSDEIMTLGVAIGIPPHDREEDTDGFIEYFDSFATFVDGYGRLPTEEELPDPF